MTTHSLVHHSSAESVRPDALKLDEFNDGVEFAGNESNASNDEVFRLREWGTHRMVPLRVPTGPRKQIEASTAGSANTTALQLSSRGIGDLELTYEGQSWRLKDWAGAVNLKQDGMPTREVTLLAGTEVTIAGRTLIAESPRTVGLRALCSRLLGWSDERIGTVDHALRAIRLASSGRAVLLLRGRGDLVPIAFAIHRHVLGEEAPFVVSDPRRENTPATVRGPANVQKGMRALRKGFGGAICVRAERLPQEFDNILKAFREPENGVRLLVCVGNSGRTGLFLGSAPIDIPSLETRTKELPRIIIEYADAAIDLLCAPGNCLSPQDLEWVAQLPKITISEVEKALRRIVAIKISRNISSAANKLGMTSVSLTRWLARRKLLKDGTRYAPQPSS